jgi:nucleotide-binding universal stress UspA family protein
VTVAEVLLCAIDATPSSVQVVRAAVRLARKTREGLVLLHVVDSVKALPRWYAPRLAAERAAYAKFLRSQITALEQRLLQLLHQADGDRLRPQARILVEAGGVVDHVLSTALERSASLIIIGKGREPGAIAVVAERIARQSQRPVLLVPTRAPRGRAVKLPLPRARVAQTVRRLASKAR